MMLQNGVNLPMKKGESVKLEDGATGSDGKFSFVGENALKQYSQYSLLRSLDDGTTNPLYNWNIRNHYSVDAFAEGSVAMMFNYSWQISSILNKNPKLNFAVAPMPQLNASKPVTVSNYWGYVVSRNKVAPVSAAQQNDVAAIPNEVRVHEAWQFLRFLTLKNSGTVRLYNAYSKNFKDFATKFDPAVDYLQRTKQPAARRDIIEMQKVDPILAPFASGNLIARNWYQTDPEAVDSLFNDMISNINAGRYTLREALALTSNRINGLSK
jgi:ABC-type glycerol-3-phosphate transport system substrate-binding protein